MMPQMPQVPDPNAMGGAPAYNPGFAPAPTHDPNMFGQQPMQPPMMPPPTGEIQP